MKDLSNKIKEFEKIVKVPHLKRTPKQEPTLSYFHLVECLRKIMMRSGENNHHVHNGYGKDMTPSLDVNYTNKDKEEDESRLFIMVAPLGRRSGRKSSQVRSKICLCL